MHVRKRYIVSLCAKKREIVCYRKRETMFVRKREIVCYRKRETMFVRNLER